MFYLITIDAVNTTEQLQGGEKESQEGTLEILLNDTLFTLCGDGFDYNDAKTVCRKLGYW